MARGTVQNFFFFFVFDRKPQETPEPMVHTITEPHATARTEAVEKSESRIVCLLVSVSLVINK